MKMGGNEDAFQQLKEVLDRAIDQILSGIPESDHVDTMCDVVELIEGHTEEEVKYTLGKMFLVLTQISAGLKAIQGASDLQQALQQIQPDRVQRLSVAEHELLQMQVQLDEVRKENVIIKRSNTQQKKHGSWANLKGGGQLADKVGNGAQMRGMVPGLGSGSGCPHIPTSTSAR